MDSTNPPLILRIWKQPATIEQLDVAEIELLVRQAKASQLLASLRERLIKHKYYSGVCARAKRHFESAALQAQRHQELTSYELQKVAQALEQEPTPPVILKGAAYSACGLPASKGRVFSDIDILVPRHRLQQVESQLMMGGWLRKEIDDYDDEYYRLWMHEIPPLTHTKRGSILDVHHNILPLTATHIPDASKLQNHALPISNEKTLYALAPVDMLLHSATHLFHEGEFDKGLRDLIDLDQLLRYFASTENSFWSQLTERAEELKLGRPLFYTLRYCRLILDCPVPNSAFEQSRQFAPSSFQLYWMDFLFEQIFVPHHSSCDSWKFRVSRETLYWRGHLLRMPPGLLIPHLCRKSLMRLKNHFRKDKVA